MRVREGGEAAGRDGVRLAYFRLLSEKKSHDNSYTIAGIFVSMSHRKNSFKST